MPYCGARRWMRNRYDTLPPNSLLAQYDAQEEPFDVNQFVNTQHGYGTPSGVAVPVWYDWVEKVTFDVVVCRIEVRQRRPRGRVRRPA